MGVLIVDGHPDKGRLTSHLLDHYATQLGEDVTLERIAARDPVFNPNLAQGYKTEQPWEPDLKRVATDGRGTPARRKVGRHPRTRGFCVGPR